MSIGAYAVEKDYSHYIAYIANTIFAVVGTATKGPIGVPTVCTSAQDLVNKFGPLKEECYALYAGQYFLSQSSKLYFVRAASDSATEATTTLVGKDAEGNRVLDAITISVLEKGTYADGFSVTVSAGTPKKDTITDTETATYNLIIKDKLGTTVEIIRDISMDELASTNYVSNSIKVTAINSKNSAVSLETGTPATADTPEIPATYTFAGGNDGIIPVDMEDEDNNMAAVYITAGNTLLADTIDMNLFAVPGISDHAVITAMLGIAESRGDCLYLVDPPTGLTRDGVISWHNGSGDYKHTLLNSSYGALYYDWVTIYDSVNKKKVSVPPSVVVAASYAYSDRTSEVWYAPAGLNRGVVRGVLESNTKLSKSDTDLLYSGDNNINSLYDDPQVGLVLWGQKTLSRADTALNRVNVRRLLNYLKRVITAACNYLTFEPNDRITWNSFRLKIDPLLKNIQSKRGIYEYSIVKGDAIVTDEDIDNYRMPCKILIRPTKAAEEIPIYFTITSTGADFNEVLEYSGVTIE